MIDFFDRFRIRNSRSSLLISVTIFILMMQLFYQHMGVYEFIDKRPSSIHFSAQTSRASVALNYYENDMNFFTPQYQRTLEGKGYTGLEFPIIYYMGAVCYKLFGFHEVWLRAISLVVTTLGLLFFFLLTLNYTKNNWLSLGVILAVTVSPVFVFYTPNFMPDPPSIGLILASWYFLLEYSRSGKNKHINIWITLLTLGVLLKITGGIALVIVFCILILDQLKFFRNSQRDHLFANRKAIWFRMAASVLVVVAWYKYSTWFPATHGGGTFLLSTNHFKEMEDLTDVLSWMKKLWLNHYYSYESYILLGIAASIVLLFCWLADRLLLTITLLYLLGCAGYFLFFLHQFRHHDYYVITAMPAVFFLFLTFADVVTKLSYRFFYPLQIAAMLMLFFNLKESFRKTRINLHERNSVDIFYWTGDYRAYEDLEPKLRKLGIKREDRVVSGFDNSDCGSIYLMNQLGATFGNESPKAEVDAMLNHPNVKYLVLSDSAEFNRKYGYNYNGRIIATHRGLIIYKLR